jgi:hypothetical protein
MTFYHPKHYAELRKLQAASIKLQAASDKRLQPEVASTKRQAASYKHQASSDSRKDSKAASDKQQAS